MHAETYRVDGKEAGPLAIIGFCLRFSRSRLVSSRHLDVWNRVKGRWQWSPDKAGMQQNKENFVDWK